MPGQRLDVTVEQDEFAVRNPRERLDRSPLRGLVEREMRRDDIVIEQVEVLVDVVFEQFDLLVVQPDGNLPLRPDRRGERAEKHLLVGAQFIEEHQNLGLLPAVLGRNIEPLALRGADDPLVAQERIGLLNRLFRDTQLERELVHRRQQVPVPVFTVVDGRFNIADELLVNRSLRFQIDFYGICHIRKYKK